jgi:xanthine/uracil permease
MDELLFGIITAVVVMIVGFSLFPTLSAAITNSNLSADQQFLGTLAKTLYLLGVALVAIVIVVIAVKATKK